MNVRFHHEPWDEATETEFVGGMGAILAGYLRDVAASGQADIEEHNGEHEPSGKQRSRRSSASATAEEARHG
jgi:hypothetical protein